MNACKQRFDTSGDLHRGHFPTYIEFINHEAKQPEWKRFKHVVQVTTCFSKSSDFAKAGSSFASVCATEVTASSGTDSNESQQIAHSPSLFTFCGVNMLFSAAKSIHMRARSGLHIEHEAFLHPVIMWNCNEEYNDCSGAMISRNIQKCLNLFLWM